eukprot:EG_transcript_14672
MTGKEGTVVFDAFCSCLAQTACKIIKMWLSASPNDTSRNHFHRRWICLAGPAHRTPILTILIIPHMATRMLVRCYGAPVACALGSPPRTPSPPCQPRRPASRGTVGMAGRRPVGRKGGCGAARGPLPPKCSTCLGRLLPLSPSLPVFLSLPPLSPSPLPPLPILRHSNPMPTWGLLFSPTLCVRCGILGFLSKRITIWRTSSSEALSRFPSFALTQNLPLSALPLSGLAGRGVLWVGQGAPTPLAHPVGPPGVSPQGVASVLPNPGVRLPPSLCRRQSRSPPNYTSQRQLHAHAGCLTSVISSDSYLSAAPLNSVGARRGGVCVRSTRARLSGGSHTPCHRELYLLRQSLPPIPSQPPGPNLPSATGCPPCLPPS